MTDIESSAKEMQDVLTKALNRSLADHERNAIRWVSHLSPTQRGIVLDLFKELAEKVGNKRGRPCRPKG